MVFKDRRKRDCDNYTKSVIDSIKNILFEDDDMIYELIVRKQIGCEEDRTTLKVTSIIDSD